MAPPIPSRSRPVPYTVTSGRFPWSTTIGTTLGVAHRVADAYIHTVDTAKSWGIIEHAVAHPTLTAIAEKLAQPTTACAMGAGVITLGMLMGRGTSPRGRVVTTAMGLAAYLGAVVLTLSARDVMPFVLEPTRGLDLMTTSAGTLLLIGLFTPGLLVKIESLYRARVTPRPTPPPTHPPALSSPPRPHRPQAHVWLADESGRLPKNSTNDTVH